MRIFPRVFVITLILILFGVSCEKDEKSNIEPDNTPEILRYETKEMEVNSSGGLIELKSGVKLDIPSGALSSSTTISIDNTNPFESEATTIDTIGGLKASALVRCLPDGLTFTKPVQITIPILEDAILDHLHPDSLIMIAVSSNGIDTIQCTIDTENMLATASITHFTEFSLVLKTGKWGILNEKIDRSNENFLTLEFNAVRGKALGPYLIKLASLSHYSQVHQLVACNIRLYQKKFFVNDEFIQGIQTFKYYAWTDDDTDYSYNVKGGTYHNWSDHFDYDDFPSKKKMRQIFDVNKTSKGNEKSIGIQYVRFGPDKKVSEIEFSDRSDDFDSEILGNCSYDGVNSILPVVDLSVLDPENKYYFIIEFVGSGDIFEDNVYESVRNAQVLSRDDADAVKDELSAIKPWKAVFNKDYVKKHNLKNPRTALI